MGQKFFYFDMNFCSSCNCCQVACKMQNDLAVGDYYREVTEYEGGSIPAVWAASLSMACNHCMNPACVENCPTGALAKDADTGLVLQDKEVCIACGTCASVCPYGAPTKKQDGTVRKCEGCHELLSLGEQPPCVAACSMRCLLFGERGEIDESTGNKNTTSDLSVLPASSETNPCFLISTKQQMV